MQMQQDSSDQGETETDQRVSVPTTLKVSDESSLEPASAWQESASTEVFKTEQSQDRISSNPSCRSKMSAEKTAMIHSERTRQCEDYLSTETAPISTDDEDFCYSSTRNHMTVSV